MLEIIKLTANYLQRKIRVIFIIEKVSGREKMRKEREIRVVIMAVLLGIQLIPLSAQQNCWDRMGNCIDENATPAKFQENCCTSFLQEITNERECFCTVKTVVSRNATLAQTLSTLLTLCNVTASIDALCPGTVPSTSEVPIPSPSDTPAPSEVPSLAPPSIDLAPSELSSAFPPSADKAQPDCWTRMGNCWRNATTSSTILECCALMKGDIESDKECFCGIKNIVGESPTFTNLINQIFIACSIPGTYDTYCPGTPSSILSPTSPSTPGDSPPGILFMPPPATTTSNETGNANTNGAKKIGYSVGLLSSSMLFIWAIIQS
ncbi:uncharacterized protein LOC130801217 isoform X3 [Amaranthus tricolor]|uniref:uncharacterized protein LOC130801217 isoform X3 n=1 Tax=Amaranthus tricolor TaxID=29722 RepID=UPI0025862F1F|nr:uncharacterized protein LOC130801217 isoform X3 [Amaranthus tricolor]